MHRSMALGGRRFGVKHNNQPTVGGGGIRAVLDEAPQGGDHTIYHGIGKSLEKVLVTICHFDFFVS